MTNAEEEIHNSIPFFRHGIKLQNGTAAKEIQGVVVCPEKQI